MVEIPEGMESCEPQQKKGSFYPKVKGVIWRGYRTLLIKNTEKRSFRGCFHLITHQGGEVSPPWRSRILRHKMRRPYHERGR